MKRHSIPLLLALIPALVLAKHPRNMKPIEPQRHYQLQEDFTAKEKAATFTLRSGTYTAGFEDAQAIYLLGRPDCLEMHVVPPKQPEMAYTQSFNCGIMIPKSELAPATFFAIAGKLPQFQEAGFLINWMIRRDEGRFNFPIKQKFVVGLRAKIGPL
jgi:hypothetical protein